MIPTYGVNEIAKISIRNTCTGVMPCNHLVRVIFNDGFQVDETLEGIQVWQLISVIKDANIFTLTPSHIYTGKFISIRHSRPAEYRSHFGVYEAENIKISLFRKIISFFKKDKGIHSHDSTERAAAKADEVVKFMLIKVTPNTAPTVEPKPLLSPLSLSEGMQ